MGLQIRRSTKGEKSGKGRECIREWASNLTKKEGEDLKEVKEKAMRGTWPRAFQGSPYKQDCACMSRRKGGWGKKGRNYLNARHLDFWVIKLMGFTQEEEIISEMPVARCP